MKSFDIKQTEHKLFIKHQQLISTKSSEGQHTALDLYY